MSLVCLWALVPPSSQRLIVPLFYLIDPQHFWRLTGKKKRKKRNAMKFIYCHPKLSDTFKLNFEKNMSLDFKILLKFVLTFVSETNSKASTVCCWL